MLHKPRTFALDVVPGLETQLYGRWLQGLKHLVRHTRVEDSRLDPITRLRRGLD